MPKYTFKGLDAVSSPGPGPVLWFPSPRIIDSISGQVSRSGIGVYNTAIEITLNGSDFRAVTFQGGAGFGNLADGNYLNLGSIAGPLIGLRLNLLSLTPDGTPNLTVLLAIDERD